MNQSATVQLILLVFNFVTVIILQSEQISPVSVDDSVVGNAFLLISHLQNVFRNKRTRLLGLIEAGW